MNPETKIELLAIPIGVSGILLGLLHPDELLMLTVLGSAVTLLSLLMLAGSVRNVGLLLALTGVLVEAWGFFYGPLEMWKIGTIGFYILFFGSLISGIPELIVVTWGMGWYFSFISWVNEPFNVISTIIVLVLSSPPILLLFGAIGGGVGEGMGEGGRREPATIDDIRDLLEEIKKNTES